MKKVGVLAVSLLLTICILIIPAFAVEDQNMNTDDIEVSTVFDDIKSDDWYYESVMKMYESNVIKGYGDGRFGPNDSITHAQVLTILVRMANIDTTGYGNGSTWYSAVSSWAILNLGETPSNLNSPASRLDIANYIVKIYRLEKPVDTASPFIDTDDINAITLYNYGITIGVPTDSGELKFNGTQNLTRAQTCVMLDRLLVLDKPIWDSSPRDVVKSNYIDCLDYSYFDRITMPDGSLTDENFANAWMYAMYNACGEVEVAIDTELTLDEMNETKRQIIDSWRIARNKLLAYSSFYDHLSVGTRYSLGSNGKYKCTFTLKCFSNNYGTDEIKGRISDFEIKCAQIVYDMYTSGKLTPNMSMRDKASELYKYLDYRLQYDTTYKISGAYETLLNNSGTCNGYTGLYNYLCNLAGVPMEAACGYGNSGSHIWSVINIDGVNYHTDVTWGDPIPNRPNYSNPEWFWKPFNSFKDHTLDNYSLYAA